MPDLPPLVRDQQKADADHLRLLAIFHFVIAGLSVLGLAFLAIHYAFMHFIFARPDLWKNQKSGPPPEIFMIFKWFYAVAGILIATAALGNLISGLFILKRKHRVFSLIIAGLDCLQFPFGTVLGIFTFLVLLRDSVREAYAAGESRRLPR